MMARRNRLPSGLFPTEERILRYADGTRTVQEIAMVASQGKVADFQRRLDALLKAAGPRAR